MASMAAVFLDLGYIPHGQLDFEAKKLKALWFAPPPTHPPLPRIFISELIVDQLSAVAQVSVTRNMSCIKDGNEEVVAAQGRGIEDV